MREYNSKSNAIPLKDNNNKLLEILKLKFSKLCNRNIIYDADGYPISIETSIFDKLEETQDSYIIINKITKKKSLLEKFQKMLFLNK